MVDVDFFNLHINGLMPNYDIIEFIVFQIKKCFCLKSQ